MAAAASPIWRWPLLAAGFSVLGVGLALGYAGTWIGRCGTKISNSARAVLDSAGYRPTEPPRSLKPGDRPMRGPG